MSVLGYFIRHSPFPPSHTLHRLYTMAIEDLHHLAQSGSDLVRSHSDESCSETPVLNRSPSQLRTKYAGVHGERKGEGGKEVSSNNVYRLWEDNEAVLKKLFPDVEPQTIIDALEFCHGNRNDAIDLLAEQNK
jgi:hypothetical protein